MRFKNRQQAALQLASALRQYKGRRVIVYALPRGGVALGVVIAKKLGAPLDLLIPRKIGHPQNPEYAVAAVSERGEIVMNEEEAEQIDKQWLREAAARELAESRRRRNVYLGRRRALKAEGHICIIVDDGLATGLTMKAAISDLKKLSAKSIVVAVPVAPYETVKELKNYADELVALYVPAGHFGAISSYYQEFEQINDEKIIQLLKNHLENHSRGLGNGKPPGGALIGADTGEIGFSEEAGATYPAPENKRFGVSANRATDPIETDQGDEECEERLFGTPDDLAKQYGKEETEIFINRTSIE